MHQQWYQEVIQPRLQALASMAATTIPADFPLKKFFKELLADLEMIGLDDFRVENYVEKILDGFAAMQDPWMQERGQDLRQIASIALLTNRFDRALFLSYWTHYRPFTRRSKNLRDESIVNAYKIPMYIQYLVSYIETIAVTGPARNENENPEAA